MRPYQALLAALARTPEEDRVFWQESQKREYDRWWTLEDICEELHRLGADDEESAEMVALARAGQDWIHEEQGERAAIRDRLCDESD